MDEPVYYVDVHRSRTRFPFKRTQQWYFVVIASGNHQPVMTSEMYTNHADCVAAASKANGGAVTVWLREYEVGNRLLRLAVSE